MAIFTKLKKATRKKAQPLQKPDEGHLNWMGGTSFDVSDPVLRLRLAASSCFFGEPMYYHTDKADARPKKAGATPRAATLSDEQLAHLRGTLHAVDPQGWRGLSPTELMERAIDAALDASPERTLQEAARLRQEDHIRTTPQVILVRAARHPNVRGTGLVSAYAPKIIRRADESAVGLAYQLYRFGKPIPNALKAAWKAALERCDDHLLAKYQLKGHDVKTRDVVNLVHAKGEAVDRLMKGQLTVREQTWEGILSSKGSSRASWLEALEVMGHMALLRNLRNLAAAGVEPALFLPKLLDGVEGGQQLPFRYYSAYQACKAKDDTPKEVLDALEACLMRSLGKLPRFHGRVMSLCDNSGSAQGTTTSSMGKMRVSTIGNLTGAITGMCADEGHVGLFGDKLTTRAIDPSKSLFGQLDALEKDAQHVGLNTENGAWLFWDQAIRKKERWDAVFLYSDMQAGHGGLYGADPKLYADFAWKRGGGSPHYLDVAKLVRAYRAKVNPKVLVFLVQIAGYQDTLIPEFYDRTFILGGWGDGLLRFAGAMARQFDGACA